MFKANRNKIFGLFVSVFTVFIFDVSCGSVKSVSDGIFEVRALNSQMIDDGQLNDPLKTEENAFSIIPTVSEDCILYMRFVSYVGNFIGSWTKINNENSLKAPKSVGLYQIQYLIEHDPDIIYLNSPNADFGSNFSNIFDGLIEEEISNPSGKVIPLIYKDSVIVESTTPEKDKDSNNDQTNDPGDVQGNDSGDSQEGNSAGDSSKGGNFGLGQSSENYQGNDPGDAQGNDSGNSQGSNSASDSSNGNNQGGNFGLGQSDGNYQGIDPGDAQGNNSGNSQGDNSAGEGSNGNNQGGNFGLGQSGENYQRNDPGDIQSNNFGNIQGNDSGNSQENNSNKSQSTKKSSSSTSKSSAVKTGENPSYLLAIMLGSLVLSLSCILEQRKKSKIGKSDRILYFFHSLCIVLLRVMEKFGSQLHNKEVFFMFDFLKKSRVAKFLCSACLVCSLGSFDFADGTVYKISQSVAVDGPLVPGIAEGCVYLSGANFNRLTKELTGTFMKKGTSGGSDTPVTSTGWDSSTKGGYLGLFDENYPVTASTTITWDGDDPHSTADSFTIGTNGKLQATMSTIPEPNTYSVIMEINDVDAETGETIELFAENKE